MINIFASFNSFLPQIIIIGVLLFTSMFTHAANWENNIATQTTYTYSDNLTQVSSDEISGFVKELVPSISSVAKGGRVETDLYAQVEINSEGEGADAFTPSLDFMSSVELLQKTVFIDVEASISQNSLDPFQSAGSDLTNNKSNKTTTINYSISPYIRGNLGNVGLEVRYDLSRVKHSEAESSNSQTNTFSFTLENNRPVIGFDWRLEGEKRETIINADMNAGSKFASIDLSVEYKVNRHWKIITLIGNEKNEFNSTSPVVDGMRTDIGFEWTPSPRMSLRLAQQDRYSGNALDMIFSYKLRHSVFTANYSQENTDANTLISEQDRLDRTDAFDVPIDIVSSGTDSLSSIDNERFINESFNLGWAIQGKRTQVNMTSSFSNRKYLNSDRDESSLGLSLNINRQLTLNTSGRASLSSNMTLNEVNDSETNTINLIVGVDRAITAKTKISLEYGLTKRETDVKTDDFTENKLTATLRAEL